MRLVPLGSGSRGNATLVELGSLRFLVDAGLSAKVLHERLLQAGVEPRTINWIVLSHEHEDHARGVGRFSRLYGVPLLSSPQTLEALNLSPAHLAGWRPLAEGGLTDLGPVRIDSFPVPHDAARPVGFVLHGEGMRIGFATDLGHATTLVIERLRGCEVLMIEANHDDAMLQAGPYPWALKQRVGGRMGHLSNEETAGLLRETTTGNSRAVVLAHLSEKNNRPGLARRVCAAGIAEAGAHRVTLRVASPQTSTPAVVL